MATFRALNIEYDDEDDIEIDNTKEIQIEEALKLYQDALKLHSEGPQSFPQAADAYRALFQSEIFHYPESLSEIKRQDLYESNPDQDDFYYEQEGEDMVGYPIPTEENALGTLPHLIHLSQKNYGQFVLESLQHQIANSDHQPTLDLQQPSADALNAFVESLDKDDTDPDLWRRTAAVAHLLSSDRIARYCLESVLDADDAGIEAVLSIPGLSQTFAAQQLRDIVLDLDDKLSILQPPLSTFRKKKLSKLLKTRLGTYQSLIEYQRQHPLPKHLDRPSRITLHIPSDWADLGDFLLRHAQSEPQPDGTNAASPEILLDPSPEKPEARIDSDIMLVDEPAEPMSSLNPALPPPTSIQFSSLPFDQFVGMPDGRPSAPVAAFALDMPSPSSESNTILESAAYFTRKRSTDAAGFQDSPDPSRSRSKRVRARESIVDQSIIEDEPVVDKQRASYQLAELDYFDNMLVETVDETLEKLHLPRSALRTVDRSMLRSASDMPDSDIMKCLSAGRTQRASLDLYHFFDSPSDTLARVLLTPNNDMDSTSEAHVQPKGMSIGPSGQSGNPWPDFNGPSMLNWFVRRNNERCLHINQTILYWLNALVYPLPDPARWEGKRSIYTTQKWQEPLKTTVLRVIVEHDHYIYQYWQRLLQSRDEHLQQFLQNPASLEIVENQTHLIQTLFELHLDVYCAIKEPNSGVDDETLIIQGDRTDRWANLARDAMNQRLSVLDLTSLKDELNLRYLWAATHHIGISGDVSREHTISCWQELRAIFVAVGSPNIELQNNQVMAHLCVESIDRELSRLTTQEFFVKMFHPDHEDFPVIIETLEPLLELLHTEDTEALDGTRHFSAMPSATTNTDGSAEAHDTTQSPAQSDLASPELIKYLQESSTQLRISLWQRLREAYEAIDYPPMVVCCYFRIIETLVAELRSSAFAEKAITERQTILLKYLRLSHDLLNRILVATDKHENALECMDMARIEAGLGAVVNVLKILHTYTLFHDDVRVGFRPSPVSATALRTFKSVTKLLQEMQIHSWMLLYKLVGEAIPQNSGKFDSPDNSLFSILRGVHNVLGARSMCGNFKGIFLKMVKQEYIRMRVNKSVSSDYFDIEFAQVLFDLYGLELFLNAHDLQPHDCQLDTSADKHSAMQAVDLLLTLTSNMKMVVLLKNPIKDTIEKVHALVTRKKPSDAILKNREIIRSFLKSPINPADLYNCVSGIGTLTLRPVPDEHAILAAKGWYFLMGHIHLSRFRSQKRTAPAATDDLNIAVALFMQELEYSMDNWETWFRIAQAYDSKIEEHVSWSAEKLGGNSEEIINLQKSTIHCYRMAVALAMRSAEPGQDTTAKLAELFSDFAMRIYASTREPFDMQAFSLDDVVKFFSVDGIVKGKPFVAMQPYVAWKIARVFFKTAISLSPDNWILHYQLSKCTWKMFCHDNGAREFDKVLIPEDITGEIIRAIQLLPTKTSKKSPAEPILEPHYKLVSVVHKMVAMDELEPSEACRILLATPHAAKVEPVNRISEWEDYILRVLKNLRTADKSHWQHRMIARTAHIVYHDGIDESSIQAAKHELTQQMFTKTMTLQIWKPVHQRPGRHFVYFARYIKFFAKILEQLNDRTGLEGLARRVRKRQADIFEHASVWHEICQSYLKVLRKHGNVPPGHETAVFSGISHEAFVRRKEYLEKWCHDSSSSSPILEVLQEAIELKKLNGTLMKPGSIDDLVGDAYAYLYDTVGRRLWKSAENEDVEGKPRQDAADAEARVRDMQSTAPPGLPASPARNARMNLSHLMNMDGTGDVVTPPMSRQPSAMPTPSAADAAAPQAEGQAQQTKQRKLGVGRREIRLCADACVTKPATTTSAISTSTSVSNLPRQEVRVVIEVRPKVKTDNGGGNNAIRTDAGVDDDESDSELSDVDEELVTQAAPGKSKTPSPKPMFPGLAKIPVSSKHSSDVEEEEEEDYRGPGDGVGDDDDEDDDQDEDDEQDQTGDDEDIEMGDGGDDEEAEGDEDEDDDGSELQASSAAWHNQQARLANLQAEAAAAEQRELDNQLAEASPAEESSNGRWW